jgi:hypothetical protein
MELQQIYLAPELRPGFTFLVGQNPPKYVTEANREHAACILLTNAVHDLLDECTDMELRPELQRSVELAMAREYHAMQYAARMNKTWQQYITEEK